MIHHDDPEPLKVKTVQNERDGPDGLGSRLGKQKMSGKICNICRTSSDPSHIWAMGLV